MKATEVTSGLAESNGSLVLLPGLWRDSLHFICGLTACYRDQLRAQRSVTSVGKLYLYLFYTVDANDAKDDKLRIDISGVVAALVALKRSRDDAIT